MKIITYGSYGGRVPDAVMDYAEKHHLSDIRSDPALVAFVEGFAGETLHLADSVRDRLWACPDDKKSNPKAPIKRTTYAGWGRVEGSSRPLVATLTVNEFNESTTRAIVSEYDGAESLDVVPEYEPVPEIPGLYRAKQED